MMRVFIADDEEIIRDGIRNCIEKEQERFLFAGEAPDGEMALPMLMEMKPDVLITDIRHAVYGWSGAGKGCAAHHAVAAYCVPQRTR